MNYQPVFDPSHVERIGDSALDHPRGDRRDGGVYVYQPEIVLAVNVALATGRPLLIRGPSGCGKSALAPAVALKLGWRYYEFVVTGRSDATELMWRFDSLKRLASAQVGANIEPVGKYVQPGVLWWAIDPGSACRRGLEADEQNESFRATDPAVVSGSLPTFDPASRAVVLIDEIDKADIDFPNDLLVPLGSLEFVIHDTDRKIRLINQLGTPLVIITTNDERDLPGPFIRRCILLEIEAPSRPRLIEIGCAHFGVDDRDLIELVADKIVGDEHPAAKSIISAAEFLDVVRACKELGIDVRSDMFKLLTSLTVRKQL